MADDIEKYKKLQQRSLEELQYEMKKRNELEHELEELEKQEVVKRFLDVRHRWGSANGRVSTVQGQLGLWTLCLTDAEKKEP